MTDERQKYERQVGRDRIIHYAVYLLTITLIAFSIWFAYMSSQKHKVSPNPSPDVVGNEEVKGKTKALPEFIIDKVPSDELEQLKP